jgi:predicted nucleic acid-binding protein
VPTPAGGYVVLDTDVASRILRQRLTGPLAVRLVGVQWCVTFVTVGELWKWAEIRAWGPDRRDELARWLGERLVLPSANAVSRRWGVLSASAQKRGRPGAVNDTWIAAACLVRGLPLATLNRKDFEDFAEHDGLVLL